MSEPVLELSRLQKSYHRGWANELRVLTSASATLSPGEVVALVAPSGAGKSTLLHIAGLLDQADGGAVRVLGRDLTRAPERVRTEARRDQIGFVYQFHHLLPEFSALENIVLPQLAAGVARGAAEARGQELLAQMGIAERAHHRPAELSGGEQQRVAVARALVTEPAVVWADEPTGNLDSATAAAVLELFAEMNERGQTMVVVTHDAEIGAVADRIVQVRDGRVRAEVAR